MKTVIFNGSPRKNGDTVAMINEAKKYLKGEVKIVDTYYTEISPCIDCRHCLSHENCAIDDDMQEIYRLMDEVDNVIIASPLYFSELTGELLSFASRFQVFFAQRVLRKEVEFKLKEKNGFVILARGGDGGPATAEDRADCIFRHIYTKSIGTAVAMETEEVPAKDDQKALGRIKKLVLELNRLYDEKVV